MTVAITVPRSPQLKHVVYWLGELLGIFLKDKYGEQLFAMEEDARKVARELRRADNPEKFAALKEKIEALEDENLRRIVRVFTVFIFMRNVAVELDDRRAELQRLQGKKSRKVKRAENAPALSVLKAVQRIKSSGKSAAQLANLLEQVEVRAVITAHPTQAMPRDVVTLLTELRGLLAQPWHNLGLNDRLIWAEGVHACVERLFDTAIVQDRRPVVEEEVDEFIRLVGDVLFDALPAVYEALHRAREVCYPGKRVKLPRALSIGSWPGGDMDGNPNATPIVLRNALESHRSQSIVLLIEALGRLERKASQSPRQAPHSARFGRYLKACAARLGEPELAVLANITPYRFALQILSRRLQDTLHDSYRWPLRSSRQLWRLLGVVQNELTRAKANRFAEGEVATFRRQINLFGFHLASLDVRRNSPEHAKALDEMFAAQGDLAEGAYLAMEESDRCQYLTRWILGRRSLVAFQASFSPGTERVWQTFLVIADAHRRHGPRSVENYIVSHTEEASDLLEVVLLARQAGLIEVVDGRIARSSLNIVPLFETVADFPRAHQVMETLYLNPAYSGLLKAVANRQIVMLGFSDGAKSASLVTAHWQIYELQERLTAVALRYSVTPVFFHGRGGSLARGGGLRQQAILTQPGEVGRVFLTVQGEDARRTLGHFDVARDYGERMLHAALLTAAGLGDSSKLTTESRIGDWRRRMTAIAEGSYASYLRLTGHERFVEFFYAVTPIAEWGELPIGSRPASRKKGGGLDALRAIPWVAAWNLSRIGAAAWFGAGSGFAAFLDEAGANRAERLMQLREMYHHWPFFRVMIDGLERTLSMVDLATGEEFSKLCPDEDLRQELWGMIRQEFELSVKSVLEIKELTKLLERNSRAREERNWRLPHLKLMGLALLTFLRRCRSLPEGEARDAYLKRYVLLGLCATAAGLNETG